MGIRVGVLLFVDSGDLSEVEIYGLDGKPTNGLPEPSSLELSDWTAPDSAERRHLSNP